MEFFDNHCHLDDEKFDVDREELIASLKQENKTKVISAGYSLEGTKNAIELSKKYDFIYTTCGISPNDIPQTKDEVWKVLNEVEELIQKNEKIVAVGEIGLDYYWNHENKEIQRLAFEKQIEIANKNNLPIVIHTREAVIDTLDILKNKNVNKKGVFHCCPLNPELVKEALKLGFYISLAGPVTFKNSKNADEIIQMIPLEKLLIETDSPYLSPEPFRGRRNTPINVKLVAEKIAKVKQLPLEEVAKITYENAKRLFNIF